MTSLNTFSPNKILRGFTLIEILVVIAIVTMLMALGLFMSLDSYRSSLSRSDRDQVVSLLQKARSRSMANINQASWGVCYISPNYILFRGSACTAGASTNEAIGASNGVSVTGLADVSPVVFTQLSGTTTSATVVVTQQGKSATININDEGTISW